MLSLARHYVFDQWVETCPYQVYRFDLSSEAIRAMRMIRRYFQALLRHDMPELEHRRYQYPFEYADLSVIILTRIHAAFERNFPIVAGSRFLGQKAWAVLGKDYGVQTDKQFDNFSDLIDYYDDQLHGMRQSVNFLFRFKPKLIENLAKINNISCNSVFTIALLFLKDAILHTGPDAEEFFDLFTNDCRLEPDVWDIPSWEKLRCRFLGRFGEINWKGCETPNRYFATVDCEPQKFRIVANFELLSSGDELLHNEKYFSAFPIWTDSEADAIMSQGGIA